MTPSNPYIQYQTIKPTEMVLNPAEIFKQSTPQIYKTPFYQTSPTTHTTTPNPTSLVENIGLLMLGLYHVVVIIVLLNILIALMSHSFEAIQVLIA